MRSVLRLAVFGVARLERENRVGGKEELAGVQAVAEGQLAGRVGGAAIPVPTQFRTDDQVGAGPPVQSRGDLQPSFTLPMPATRVPSSSRNHSTRAPAESFGLMV